MKIINIISSVAVPAMIFLILSHGLYKRVNVYDVFVQGAFDGVMIIKNIIGPIIGLFVAINMFKASGALDLLTFFIKPVTKFLRFPTEIIPFALLRPISGSGSLALATDIFKTHGPDSIIGRAASVMMGSTETTFYTLTVYFGAIGIKNIKYSLKCALIADVVGILLSVWICLCMFN